MSDDRRIAPATVPLEPEAVTLHSEGNELGGTDAGSDRPAPLTDVGAARRRSRSALRIPDDAVARSQSGAADGSPLADSGSAVAASADVLSPTRIIAINPPPSADPPAPRFEARPPGEDDENLEDPSPIPLISRPSRGSIPSPSPVGADQVPSSSSRRAAVAPSFPPPAPSRTPSDPVRPPSASAQRSSMPPPGSVPRARAASPLPSPPAKPLSDSGAAREGSSSRSSRPSGADGELSADDIVAIDAAPSQPKAEGTGPAVRARLPSHPPIPPVGKKPAPARRPSKPPLVFIPPHMGRVSPQQADGSSQRRRGRHWWEELFNDDYLRAAERLTDDQLAREVNFIEESLSVERGGAVLDMACGAGRHAVELARRGYQVVAFDLSLSMLARASDEAHERSAKLNFVQGDMREMTFAEQFDGVVCWNTSFGYFDEEKNAAVIDRIHSALKSGGLLLLDVVNRDFVVHQSPSLAWFEGDGCVCMDEMVVDFITSRMRVKRTMMLDDGRSREIEYSVRVYSLHELGKMLHEHGFKVCEVSGRIATPGVFFGHESPRTIILAEKR